MRVVIYAQYFEPDVVYRHKIIHCWICSSTAPRATIYAHQIDHDDMRGLVRNLKMAMPFGIVQGSRLWF